jgi:8-oxo-dGTP diphosphatase
MSHQEPILVACAIIEKDKRILAAKRSRVQSHSGFWEFPGGKIAASESPETAVVREIKEELCAAIRVKRRLDPATFEYPGKRVTLIPFVCDGSRALFVPLEHEEVRWVNGRESESLAWLPPDQAILAAYLKSLPETP